MSIFVPALIGSVIFYMIVPMIFVTIEYGKQKKLKRAINYSNENSSKPRYAVVLSRDGKNKIWLQSSGETIKVELANSIFYRLISADPSHERYKLQSMLENEFLEQCEGMSLWIMGDEEKKGGLIQYSGSEDRPLFLILFQEEQNSWNNAVEDALSHGNYFLSPWLNPSIFTGMVLNIIFLSLAILENIPIGFVFFSVIFTLVPLLPLLPPGLFFTLYSIKLWKKVGRTRINRILSLICFALSFPLNGILLFRILFILIVQ